MLRIGLIGSESSHAEAFGKICNLPDENGRRLFEDVSISAICGIDDNREHTKRTAESAHIESILETPAELIHKCDAVMILNRRGSEHIAHSIPFIKKGIPVFIDKPVCTSLEDIALLKAAVEGGNCVVAGGSGTKLTKNVLNMKRRIESGELGAIKGGVISHHADIDSIYEGIYFYMCHSVEIMLTIFGYDPLSVNATVLDNENFSAAVKYKDKLVVLNMNNCRNERLMTVYGTKSFETTSVYDFGYADSIRDFADRIRGNRITKSVDQLVKNIYVLRAVETSIKEKREADIGGLNDGGIII